MDLQIAGHTASRRHSGDMLRMQVDLRSDYERKSDGDTAIMRSASSLRTVSKGNLMPVGPFSFGKVCSITKTIMPIILCLGFSLFRNLNSLGIFCICAWRDALVSHFCIASLSTCDRRMYCTNPGLLVCNTPMQDLCPQSLLSWTNRAQSCKLTICFV